jgi:RNA polymerase sigma-70 factor (ECF subfamily)
MDHGSFDRTQRSEEPLCDGALVRRALAGDSEAFRVLTERHSIALFHLAYRLTSNEQDAEDVVQETFLRAFRNLKRYESRALFSTWLHRIAANYAMDLLRNRKHLADRVGGACEADWLESVASADPGAEQIAYSGQIRESIDRAMKQLSAQERTAFVLRHYQDFSIEEISRLLGLRENATKHSIFRAVRKLRRVLEPLAARV